MHILFPSYLTAYYVCHIQFCLFIFIIRVIRTILARVGISVLEWMTMLKGALLSFHMIDVAYFHCIVPVFCNISRDCSRFGKAAPNGIRAQPLRKQVRSRPSRGRY
jgi:hypothetical protein